MKIFLDTSSLIKLYHSEIGTDFLDKIFEGFKIEAVYLSDITKVEFNSAIWKKVKTHEFSETEANNFSFIEVDSELVELSRDLVSKYGLKGLRILDSFQLASIVKN
jgi:uncharacterized protein